MVTAIQRQFWFDAVLACPALSATDSRVAAAIGFCVHVGSETCFISRKRISEKSACGEKTVARSVRRLEESGWLKVHHTGGRHANVFTLCLPPPLQFPDDNKIAEFGPMPCDKKDDTGKTAALSVDKNSRQDKSEPGHSSDRVEHSRTRSNGNPNPVRVATGLNIREPGQMTIPTRSELCPPKRIKEKITYNPFDAQPATEGVSCSPSSMSGKQPAGPPMLVFVECDTKPGRAWEAFWLRTKRVRPNWYTAPDQGYRRGWYFPTEFPPDDAA